ncbi:MAG: hypothetical protein ACR2K2_16045 [Mycobacteriales bacterium]
MYALRRLTSAAFALVLLTGALLASVLLAVPVSAAERVVAVTADGVAPAMLQVQPGDKVSFTVNNRILGGTRLQSTGGPWAFDEVRGDLIGQNTFTVPQALVKPGTYSYTATRGSKSFPGSVVVPDPSASAAPPPDAAATPAGAAPSAGAGPPPAASAAPASSPPAPPTGGTGSTALPPLTGGFGPAGPPAPMPGGIAPAPTLALPLLPEQQSFGPLSATAPAPTSALTATAVAGDLAGQPTLRGYGLPAVIAAVLAGGVLSLLVRLWRAEPAVGRERSFAGPSPVATVE